MVMLNYNLDIEKVVDEIKKRKSKNVLIQLPEGLKPEAKKIVDSIRKQTNSEVLIWFDTCFGACDLPKGIESLKVDLIIQWGHNEFKRVEGW